MKKYSYAIKFYQRETAPDNVGSYVISGSDTCKVKDMEGYFKDYLSKNNLRKEGNSKIGKILNNAGYEIGNYSFHSNTID